MRLTGDLKTSNSVILPRLPVKKTLIYIMLIVVFTVGMWIRFSNPLNPTINVNDYYFHRSYYLWQNGALPESDVWNFAPQKMPENIPPLLAYATIPFFTAAAFLLPPNYNTTDMLNAALYFPPFFYAGWMILAFFFLKRILSTRGIILFLILLTFIPASISLFAKNNYDEEILGIILLFLFIICLLHYTREKRPRYFWGMFAGLTLLELAWQQFTIIFIALLLVAIFMYFKERKTALVLFSILPLSLLAGHIISRREEATAYSPIDILKEAWIFASNFSNPDLQMAMRRNDWSNIGIHSFLDSFGWLGAFLVLFGMARLAMRRDAIKDMVIFIFTFVCGLSYFFFSKNVSLFLPAALLTASYGGETLISRRHFNITLGGIFSSALKNPRIRLGIKYAIIIFAAVSVFLTTEHVVWLKRERLEGNIIISVSPEIAQQGEPQKVEIYLQNGAVPTLKEKGSHAGFHIEVKNTAVKNIRAYSPYGSSNIVIKPDAIKNNWYWFETKFPHLNKNEQGNISFEITPASQNAEFRVRAWLPASCSIIMRLAGIRDRRDEFWNPISNGWRHESCIVRIPSSQSPQNTDYPVIPCAIPVFAGYLTQRNFNCLRYQISSKI